MQALLWAVAVVVGVAVSAQPMNCQGTPNTIPIWTEDPILLNSSANGKLYMAGSSSLPNPLYVMHMYGTAYEMGYAHGELLFTQINTLIPQVMQYIDEQLNSALMFLPPAVRQLIEEYGVDGALDAVYLLAKPYISAYFVEELQGIADASGIDVQTMIRMSMFPELIKASCSMFGAWGPAIAKTDGTLYQLRALDWSTDGPFQQFPVVFVYHPSDNGHAFLQMSWVGFIGALTGYSSAPVGVCEKVWLSYNGTDSREGIPFHFLLRDILQFDVDITSAISRIANAQRTCSIWVGVGDGYHNQFRTIQYAHDYIEVFDDYNFPAYPPEHPLMQGVVFVDKHVQPSHDPCLGSLMQEYYGSLNVQNTVQYITAQLQTGDMHIGIYDYAMGLVYVANASPWNNSTQAYTPAYDQQFVMLNATALFAEPQSSSVHTTLQ